MRRIPPPAVEPPYRAAPAHSSDLAPRVALSITSVVILGFFTVAITYALRAQHSASGLTACISLMLLLLGLQLCHSFPGSIPLAARYRRHTLLAQVVLTYVPFTVFGAAWLGMPGFLAASSLLVLKSALGWTAFGVVVVSSAAIQFAVGYGMSEFAYNTVATALTGLVVYGLSRLADLVRELQAAREELARLAVTRERLRFARDLHDLLGYSLSTITLKCELTHRLVRRQPERAEAEITEILQTARQALADVRSVASSYLRMSLGREITAAESLLSEIGIQVTLNTAANVPSGPVDTVLATVLREGITNMLRHSKAQHCVIETRSTESMVIITVANDGVCTDEEATLSPEGLGKGGSGLDNLATRVDAVSGRLIAGLRDDGWFELSAALPIESANGSETATEAGRAAAPGRRAVGRGQNRTGKSTGTGTESGASLTGS